MTKVITGMMLVAVVALPAKGSAQDAVVTRVQGALDPKLVQPECKVEGGDFRVSSGKTYLFTGIEASEPGNRAAALKNGVRVTTEAITAGQGKSSAAWYWLGRLYLQQGDLAGADSAFSRTLALAPGCKGDIQKYRYRVWAALVNAGTGYRQAKQIDSAMVMYRAASQIYQDAPLAFVNMADIFNSAGENDSAMYYYGRAAQTESSDPAQTKLRDQAAYNYGVLLLTAGRNQEAVTALGRYVSFQPDDIAGRRALARALRSTGKTDSAQVIERGLSSSAGMSEADLMDVGARQYGDKNYKEAAATFGQVVAMNPFNRDALFDQANAYLALGDGANLAATAAQLSKVEPFSEYAYSLQAQGHKLVGNKDGLYTAIVAREALLVNLEIEVLKVTADGATLTGKLTGREARDENNKLLSPKVQSLTVDFLGDGGTVVVSQDVEIPALKAGESAPFKVDAKGSGIKGWRYRLK